MFLFSKNLIKKKKVQEEAEHILLPQKDAETDIPLLPQYIIHTEAVKEIMMLLHVLKLTGTGINTDKEMNFFEFCFYKKCKGNRPCQWY